ncbi:hypothetical protein COLO4_13173 [Corchorus olitorius]|uniref:Retrotransposon gag protein n=1 Tax=Corchorus olitorius TaxID=93759 RepID=A0A1R3JY50_9ROSI|nr:hypothetical protein COLO4_13173 [Corchorus olitorius]
MSHLPTISETAESVDVVSIVNSKLTGFKMEILDDVRDLFDQALAKRDRAPEKNAMGSTDNTTITNETPLPSYSQNPTRTQFPYHQSTPPPWTPPTHRAYNPTTPPWPSNLPQTNTTAPPVQNPSGSTWAAQNPNPPSWAAATQPPWSDTYQTPQWQQPLFAPRYRMDLPRFNGDDFKSWFAMFDQYLEMEQVPDEYKPKVTMMACEGPALHWHQFYVNSLGGMAFVRWQPYLAALRERFGSTEFADPLFDLVRLRHTGTVRQYYDDFMALLNISGTPEPQALCIFLANLKDEILGQLRLYRPRSLVQAAEMSILIEANLEAEKKHHSYTKTTTTTQIHTIPATKQIPPKSPLPDEERGREDVLEESFDSPELLEVWDFSKLTMQFHHDNEWRILKGIHPGQIQ